MFDILFVFILHLLLVICFSEGLNSNQCKDDNSDVLFGLADQIANQADAYLVPSQFKSVVSGYLVLIEDETDGEEAGGGTNTFGSYFGFAFNSSDVFPPTMCSIPTNTGGKRCDPTSITALSYLLGPRDVIAFVSCTPPPMKYFSYDMIIDVRLTEAYPYYPGQNFGDPISNLNVNVEGASAFDQPVVVIHAADTIAASQVSNAYVNFANGSISFSSVSVRGIPSSTVRLWNRANGMQWEDSRPDILSLIMRLSVPEGGLSDPRYVAYKKTFWPVRLYFADDNLKSTTPLSTPMKSRYSNNIIKETSEYQSSLDSLEESIKANILDTYSGTYQNTATMNFTAQGYYDDWDDILALKNNASFAAPTRDAVYGLPIIENKNSYLLVKGIAGVFIGVIHSKVLNASYSSVGIDLKNDITQQFFEVNWLLDSQLEGSASRYFPSSKSDDLFAIDFFPPGLCHDSLYPQWCIEYSESSLSKLQARITLGERIYLLGETMIGPYAYDLIPSKLLLFQFPV